MENQPPKTTRYYTLPQVAKIMKISYSTLFNMVKNGKMPTVNIAKTGNRVIHGISADDINAYYRALSSKRKGHPNKHPESPQKET